MFSDPIEFLDAQITSIHHKVTDDTLQTRIQVSCTLYPDIADELGAKTITFLDNGAPKLGFKKLEVDTGCQAFRAVFQSDPSLKQSFEVLSGDSTDRYLVTRQANDVLQLKLRLNFHGDPHAALAYVAAVGNAQSILKIVPLQRELQIVKEPEAKPNGAHRKEIEAKPAAAPASKDAVRQSLINHQSRKRAARRKG